MASYDAQGPQVVAANKGNHYGYSQPPQAGEPVAPVGGFPHPPPGLPPGQQADTFDYAHFKRRHREFTFGLCTCCSRGSGFCCEALCCFYCNLGRQCSMCCDNTFDNGCLYCALMMLGDVICSGGLGVLLCCGGPVACCTNCCTRAKTRRRFDISGGCCEDCCAAMCCPWCVVQQSLGEFFVHRYDPPTSCCSGNSYPTPQIQATAMQ